MKYIALGLAVLSALALGHIYEEQGQYMASTQPPMHTCSPATQKCDLNTCQLPDCKCSGNETAVPVASDRPQIVYLTYDDALTNYAHENFYDQLFNWDSAEYFNPDGCNIRATHFLSAQYTDYSLVHKYWKMGHEMASHSVTHRSDQNYWKGLNMDGWAKELNGMRSMAAQMANIPYEHIIGTRAPYLQMGGDEMYQMIHDYNFLYDCSWTTRAFGYINLENGLYPYTMDYKTVQDCQIEPCPSCTLEGTWVQPMLNLEDNWFLDDEDKTGEPCSMLDGCIIINEEATSQDVYDMLLKNFERVYNGNRAPFGLYMHAGWFFGENIWHFEGYKMFLQEILGRGDVWVVPIRDGLEYIRHFDNYTNADLVNWGPENTPFGCAKYFEGVYVDRECGIAQACRFPNVTNDDIHNQERYMTMCSQKWENGGNTKQNCPDPERYPWLEDPCGGNVPCQSEWDASVPFPPTL